METVNSGGRRGPVYVLWLFRMEGDTEVAPSSPYEVTVPHRAQAFWPFTKLPVLLSCSSKILSLWA